MFFILTVVDLVFHTYFVKEHYTMTCQGTRFLPDTGKNVFASFAKMLRVLLFRAGILVVLDICLVVEGVEKANALNFALPPR